MLQKFEISKSVLVLTLKRVTVARFDRSAKGTKLDIAFETFRHQFHCSKNIYNEQNHYCCPFNDNLIILVIKCFMLKYSSRLL